MAQPNPVTIDYYSIAVIVPFRNEEQNIERLIQSLLSLNYPKDKLEIILINDHSSDQSVDVVNKINSPNIQLLNLMQQDKGKKKAITRGIEKAIAEIIVTTDADCVHHPDWLVSINSLFSGGQTQMVVGAVAMSYDSSFFSKLQAIEFSSLIGSGAALLQWNVPAMANGANLAFRKSAFHKVRGYEGNEHIASGDDEYLLRKIFNAFPGSVIFNSNPNSIVQTQSQPSMYSFLQQRLRWAGKWKYNPDMKAKLVAALVFIFQLAFIALIVITLINPSPSLRFIALAKIGIDGIFLWRVCGFLKSRFSFLAFVLLEFIYPVYVILIAVLSLFSNYSWKGRVVR